MLLDQYLSFCNLFGSKAEVHGEFHRRLDPELRLAVCMLNMNMRPSFFAGKEVEPKSLDPQNRRTHESSIAQRARIDEKWLKED